MTRTVGILAYGSLITNPGDEILAVRTRTITDLLTPFCVEYARASTSRGGGPTLVPFKNGGEVRSQLFVVDCSVEEATNYIYRREIDKVGSRLEYTPSENPGPNTVVICQIDNFSSVDIVLYTQIEPTIPQPAPPTLAALAIASVRKAEFGRDGITYLIDAMNSGVRTPLTHAYAAEILRITRTDTLDQALTSIRAKS